MRILIIGPSWVGDMVMAHTLLQRLRATYPDAVIDVAAPAWSEPLLTRMPEVRRALAFPVGHGALALRTRWRFARSLHAEYDWAIVLPNSLKSALVPWFAGIPRRTGWRGESRYGLLNDLRVLRKDRYPLMIERFMALGQTPGSPLPKPYPRPHLHVDANSRNAALNALGLNTEQPVLALCPGAEFGEAKRWPSTAYAEVAQAYLARGWQIWLFGSAGDQATAAQIQAALPAEAPVHNLAGRTQLAQAIDLLSCANAVVSNDSGLMHVAAALERPLVVVYGSSSPGFTPPLAERVAIERLGLACSPCFQRVCPLGHTHCLTQLPAARVIQALDRLLEA